MPTHSYQCSECSHEEDFQFPLSEGPPDFVECPVCLGHVGMEKIWGPAQFICSGDPDEIPAQFQTADVGGGGPVTHAQVVGPSKQQARRREKRYDDYLNERRKLFRDQNQVGGRLTHQVPAELYHGKIAQTGDQDYWRDDDNLKKHKSCKVS